MRLISQDGMIDVPYENVCVSINHRNKNQIIAWNLGCEDCEIVTMATYSNTDKALKVMEMLREQYQKLEVAKVIGCGSAERISKDATQTVAEIIISEFWKAHTFIFPKDEEVEV